MTVFTLSATDTVGKERGNQCKHYINPTTRCQAPPWKHRVPWAYREISYERGSRELSVHSRISSYWKENKYRKKKQCRKVWKHIWKYTADKQTHGNSDVHPLHCDTVISLLCGSQILELLTCSNKGWIKFKVIQRVTKCVQGHSSQLAGIFHTIRERFNHKISINPLKLKITRLELKIKIPIKQY